MTDYKIITLREQPEIKDAAAQWFSSKWGVPKEAYLECMEDYLSGKTEYGWYLCLDGDKIIGGMGVIENDFHERKDLAPNVCAVYTEPDYRGKGIAGRLLDFTVDEMKSKHITPIYLITDHVGFYERYGWEFYCVVQGSDHEPSRMYIHR
ncbi:MAG: GNAT family N-acetyltransferase [Ruminococcus sp.]|nr:GNAT family N-acetyltransferase [Ruminococcus sp.]